MVVKVLGAIGDEDELEAILIVLAFICGLLVAEVVG